MVGFVSACLPAGFHDRFGHELVASHQQLDFPQLEPLAFVLLEVASSSPIQIQIPQEHVGLIFGRCSIFRSLSFSICLSKTMLVLVTGVGALIHIYSRGYMRDDKGQSRYFAALSLFMFSMLGIVLANNFVMMFIFWELVGVSYLLIGLWFERDRRRRCCEKSLYYESHWRLRFHVGILMVVVCDRLGRLSPRSHRHMSKITAHPGICTVPVC